MEFTYREIPENLDKDIADHLRLIIDKLANNQLK